MGIRLQFHVKLLKQFYQCYAKTIGLSAEKEPDIYGAIKFGSILENVVFSPETRLVDFNDSTLTENTRWYVAFAVNLATHCAGKANQLQRVSYRVYLKCEDSMLIYESSFEYHLAYM